MELVFSKGAACNFGPLHFFKTMGILFICSFAASFQETKTSVIESIFNKVASCNANSSKIKFQLFQTNNHKVLGINGVCLWNIRRCLFTKRLQRKCFPAKFAKFLAQLFYRTPLVTASVAKTDKKKNKDILRKDTLRIFLLKHNDRKKQNYKIKRKYFLTMKYYHSEVIKNQVRKT